MNNIYQNMLEKLTHLLNIVKIKVYSANDNNTYTIELGINFDPEKESIILKVNENELNKWMEIMSKNKNETD